jgi:WD40 repeat protein
MRPRSSTSPPAPDRPFPGFFQDPETRKFFAIPEKHHAITPTEKLHAGRPLVTAHRPTREKDTIIKSSRALAIQDLQNCTDGTDQDSIRKACLARFRGPLPLPQPSRKFKPHTDPEWFSPKAWGASSIDWDPLTKTLFVASWASERFDSARSIGNKVDRTTAGSGHVFSLDNCYRTNVTDHRYVPAYHPMRMAALPGHGAIGVEVSPCHGPLQQSLLSLYPLFGNSTADSPIAVDPIIIRLQTRLEDQMGHGSALAVTPPSHGPPTILTGHERIIVRTDLTSTKTNEIRNFPSDILSTTWLQPNVAAVGGRNSSIILWDFRASQGVMRLKHSGCVAHLAPTDTTGYHLAAAGVPDALALYDLRMNRAAAKLHCNIKAVPQSQSIWKADFDCPENPGFGFSLRGDVMAASQEDGSVKVYSAKTGAVLRHYPPRLSEYGYGESIRNLVLIDDDLHAMQIAAVSLGNVVRYGVNVKK